ncbi:MAG: hypothetical protein ACRCU5_16680 [Rhizobiaceae bacterium]
MRKLTEFELPAKLGKTISHSSAVHLPFSLPLAGAEGGRDPWLAPGGGREADG